MCGRAYCVNCTTTFEDRLYCFACRPELAGTMAIARQQEGAQEWFAVWSLLLWAAGLVFFVVNMSLPETASDEVFGYVFLGVILCLPTGLVLGIM